MANNMDAIGFANSAVQSQAARAQLCDEEGLGVMGIGSAAYFENGDDVFYTYLVIDFVDYVRVAFQSSWDEIRDFNVVPVANAKLTSRRAEKGMWKQHEKREKEMDEPCACRSVSDHIGVCTGAAD